MKGGAIVKFTREIKSCPFCGEDKVLRIEGFSGYFYIRCGRCGACSTMRITEAMAIESWNRRVCDTEASAGEAVDEQQE